ncbi:MAG: hypothetical protein KAH57_09835 [Thermoplasmata archaeon]|nr:hypothetical protein [Thermoplasmata archaeon]
MAENEEVDVEFNIELNVKVSSIHSVETGIARINSSYLEDMGDDIKMVVITFGEKDIVAKLVADRLAPEGVVILRSGDVDSLKVKAGEAVTLTPYKKLTEGLKARWMKFKARFKKDKDEEGGE